VGAGGGLETVELAIRTAMTGLGGRLREDLPGLDTGYRGPRAGGGAGHEAEVVSCRAKAIDTVPGPVRLRRAGYHCATCRHGAAPKDAELGVAGRAPMSPGLVKMTARAAAAVPFAKAAGLLAGLAGIDLTTKRTGRSAEATGAATAAAIAAQTDAICARQVVPLPPPGPLPDMLYTAADGTGVPMVAADTEGRNGKAGDGQARTPEINLACLFTQTSLGGGRPAGDPRSWSCRATFEPAARFGALVDAGARRRGSAHIRQLVVPGDGAVWIWNLADELFPAASQIVDLYHAREHAHDLATLATRLPRDSHPDWLAERLAEPGTGNIPALPAAGRNLKFTGSLATERDRQPGYFETNAHPMRYAHLRSLGMFAGSGAAEAGGKAAIGQRLKLSGMRWTIPGAASIATLRCQDASNRWDQIWKRPHNQTGANQHRICQRQHTQTAAG